MAGLGYSVIALHFGNYQRTHVGITVYVFGRFAYKYIFSHNMLCNQKLYFNIFQIESGHLENISARATKGLLF